MKADRAVPNGRVRSLTGTGVRVVGVEEGQVEFGVPKEEALALGAGEGPEENVGVDGVGGADALDGSFEASEPFVGGGRVDEVGAALDAGETDAGGEGACEHHAFERPHEESEDPVGELKLGRESVVGGIGPRGEVGEGPAEGPVPGSAEGARGLGFGEPMGLAEEVVGGGQAELAAMSLGRIDGGGWIGMHPGR